MLILVGVTINVALNGGLFKKAETATKQTEEQAILEEMLSMMEITDDGNFNVDRIIGKMREKYDVEYDATNGNATITGKLGKYNYIVSATEIKIKGDSEEDLAYLKSYFVGNDLVSLLADPSEFTFTDARITLDFENFDGSPELVDGYMYIPVKFNNSIYNLKIEITDESSMVVRDVIKIGESIEDTIEEVNFNTFTVGDLLENATYDSENGASSKGGWILPVSEFNEIIGYDITETGNFTLDISDVPGVNDGSSGVSADIPSAGKIIFFSSTNGANISDIYILLIAIGAATANIPDDELTSAMPWTTDMGERICSFFTYRWK